MGSFWSIFAVVLVKVNHGVPLGTGMIAMQSICVGACMKIGDGHCAGVTAKVIVVMTKMNQLSNNFVVGGDAQLVGWS